MFNKILFGFLSLFFLTNTAFASYFSDVSDDDIAINWLYENGIIIGYPDGTFKPDNFVNRAEFLKMLYETNKIFNSETGEYQYRLEPTPSFNPFPDVPEDSWYKNYVLMAYADEIVDGYPDGTFRPENTINYAEAVKIIANAFFDAENLFDSDSYKYELCVADLSWMADQSDAWYWKYFSVADGFCVIPEELLTGYYGFDPSWKVTRRDMAEMLYRAKAVKDNGLERYTEELVPNDISLNSTNIRSSAFNDGEAIPSKYTCDGEDINPSLIIEHVPDGTKSLVLIMDDSSAPSGIFTHWLVWDIDPLTFDIAESSVPSEAIEGKNDFDEIGYRGPCPPDMQTHHYYFRIYALDVETLDLDEGSTREDLINAMEGHILEGDEMVGTYNFAYTVE